MTVGPSVRGSSLSAGDAGRSDLEGDPRPTPVQRLLLWAVTLMPLHTALTISVGFPLKPSEICILLACAGAAAGSFQARVRQPLVGTEKLVWLLGVILVVSTMAALLNPDPSGRDFGFKGSPSEDLILYTYYGLLVIAMWMLLRNVPRTWLEKAIVRSIWIAFALCCVQVVLFKAGHLDTLSALHYLNVDPGRPLPGIGVLPRNGSFPNGQQLGPWATIAGIVAVRARKRWAVLACILMVMQSQSTGALLALAAALAMILVMRPSASTLVRLVMSLAVVVTVVLSVGSLTNVAQTQFGKLGLAQTSDPWITGSMALRSAKAGVGWAIMRDHPLLGVGSDRYGVDYYDYLAKVSPVQMSYVGTIPPGRAVAENDYAQVAAELGVGGLLAFALFTAGYIYLGRRNAYLVAIATAVTVADWTQQSWTFLPMWAFLAYVSAGLFEQTLADRELGRGVSGGELTRRADRPAMRRGSLQAAVLR